MSINVTASVDIVPDVTETTIESTDLVTLHTHEPAVQESDTTIDVIKHEYAIVGDALFATVNASEAPTWLTSLIDNTVSNIITTNLSDYDGLITSVTNAIDALDVAANTYVKEVNFDLRVDSRIATELETLNVTLGDTYATKVELTTAVANNDLALIQAVSDLSVAYNNAIEARATTIETAFANADSALSSSIQALTASFIDQEGNQLATASAVQGLQSFVGVDASNNPDGTGLNYTVTSHSTAFTNLENQVTGPAGDVAYSLSNLEQRSEVYADNEGARVENKFSYDAKVILNGKWHEAGFGLDTTGITQTTDGLTENTAFDSNFWINAAKFKFTNTNKTGQVSPFSIDATGATPQVTFNGLVEFTNLNNPPTHTSDAGIPVAVAVEGSTYLQTDVNPNTVWSYTAGAWRSTENIKTYADLLGKDNLAQELGYTDYNAMVAAYSAGSTLISGGYLNTGLIDVETITADKIDTKNLSIKDALGNVIFSAGQDLEWTRIANVAITSAQIGLLAVKEANIDDLQVTTIKIGDNAVTIMDHYVDTVDVLLYGGSSSDGHPLVYFPEFSVDCTEVPIGQVIAFHKLRQIFTVDADGSSGGITLRFQRKVGIGGSWVTMLSWGYGINNGAPTTVEHILDNYIETVPSQDTLYYRFNLDGYNNNGGWGQTWHRELEYLVGVGKK